MMAASTGWQATPKTGSREQFEACKAWLSGLTSSGIEITAQWEPQTDPGSYGMEFRCNDAKLNKLANKEWVARGVVTEKLRC